MLCFPIKFKASGLVVKELLAKKLNHVILRYMEISAGRYLAALKHSRHLINLNKSSKV